jgi:CheY-like chemotaxis protein
VRRAADAAHALQLLAPPHDFDLVLSDVVMPGEMDGLMLARQLRREQPALPLVLVSGYSDSALAAADFKVLRKPCAEGELLQALAQAVGRSRGPAAARANDPDDDHQP